MNHTMHAFKSSATLSVLALSVGLLSASASLAAPPARSIEALQRQKVALEAELAKVTERIQEIQASAASAPDSASTPTYYIKEFGIREVNSAGGVEPHATFVNPNPKLVVKYLRLRVTPYNAVGDVISSNIGDQSTAGMSMTGPLAQADGERHVRWEPIWYNNSASCLKIQSVQVEFVNGKTLSFSGNTLRGALAPELQNDCRARSR